MEERDLHCCGNCLNYLAGKDQCDITKEKINPFCGCRDGWEWDQFTLDEREQEANDLNY